MKLMDRVRFQRPETGEICETILAWDTGDVQFLNTWWDRDGQVRGPFVIEITRQGEDGIFRRVTDYTLDQEAEDVLRTLREIAAEWKELDENGNNNTKL